MSKNTPRLLKSLAKFLKSKKVRPFLLPAGVALIAAVVGTFLVTASRAGTNTVTAEIENGSVSSPAKEISGVGSASGGGAVAFVKGFGSSSKSSSSNGSDTSDGSEDTGDSGNSGSSSSSSSSGSTSSIKDGAAYYDAVCSNKVKASVVGKIKDKKLPEVSEIAASISHPGTFWVANDSGNKDEIYSIKQDGTLTGTIKLAAKDVDWEAIQVQGGNVYIGDLGTNKTQRSTVYIYKVPEPNGSSGSSGTASTITVKYNGASGPNAETLLVDKGGQIWIVDKNKGTSNIWKASGNSGSVTMSKVGTVGYGSEEITDGAISPDGKALVLRTYNGIYVYKVTGDVAATLKTKYCKINFSDPTGEAITFMPDNSGLLATGETKGGGIGNMTLFQASGSSSSSKSSSSSSSSSKTGSSSSKN